MQFKNASILIFLIPCLSQANLDFKKYKAKISGKESEELSFSRENASEVRLHLSENLHQIVLKNNSPKSFAVDFDYKGGWATCCELFSYDLNKDTVVDFILHWPSTGNGLAASFDTLFVFLYNENQYKVHALVSFDFKTIDFFVKDKTVFLKQKDVVSHKSHSYVVERLVSFNNDMIFKNDKNIYRYTNNWFQKKSFKPIKLNKQLKNEIIKMAFDRTN